MTQILKLSKKLQTVLLVLVLALINLGVFVPKAGATQTYLTKSTVAENNMVASGTAALAISFKTSSATYGSSDSYFQITFSSGTPAASPTVVNNCTSNFATNSGLSGSALPGSTAPTASSTGGVLTVSLTGTTNYFAASTQYCFQLTGSAFTNPTAGTYTATLGTCTSNANTCTNSSPSTDVDLGYVGLDSISGDTYTVSATVPPNFTLALSPTSDSLGALTSTANISEGAGVTATVATNALTGFYLWAEDSNAGLHSATASTTIGCSGSAGAVSTVTKGAADYAFGVSSEGAGSVDNNYSFTYGATTTTGGCLSNSGYYEILNDGSPITSNDNVVLNEAASVTAFTPAAADYTDTITVVGAGSF